MTTHYRTKGWVFKKENKNEADQDFSVFTQDFGKLELRGRAIRKINSKLRSGIDKFFLSEVEFIQGKNYKTLTDAILIRKFKETAVLNKIAELLDNFIKGQEKDERIFNLLIETLENSLQISNFKFQILYY